ncbi:UNKNOWN [Stylonychia lemnae]|uniref:Uncharacterized protein n=1 Tax=Stylonychia lemnae TaxID=5949 RepID=A0A078AP53_STYLE|nr:UNKNOWN [Stylonychia lemnae]|eukprot:CDW83102.1 UNKNOWN [Stylonychia lemnae]
MSVSRQVQVQRDRLRSRDRVQAGQQVLDQTALENQNRLKTIKVSQQNQYETHNAKLQPNHRRGESLKNSTIQLSSRHNEDAVLFNNNDRVYKDAGSKQENERAAFSRASVSTQRVDQIVKNMEEFDSPSQNRGRGLSQNIGYLENLANKNQGASYQDEGMKSFYEKSPVAKHYAHHFQQTASSSNGFNRKLKMRDTFTKIFPSYTHGLPTVFDKPVAHSQFVYPDTIEGKPTHQIDRTYTKKNDFIKIYTEEILKIANMRRISK